MVERPNRVDDGIVMLEFIFKVDGVPMSFKSSTYLPSLDRESAAQSVEHYSSIMTRRLTDQIRDLTNEKVELERDNTKYDI